MPAKPKYSQETKYLASLYVMKTGKRDINGIASWLGVSRQTVGSWKSSKSDFADAINNPSKYTSLPAFKHIMKTLKDGSYTDYESICDDDGNVIPNQKQYKRSQLRMKDFKALMDMGLFSTVGEKAIDDKNSEEIKEAANVRRSIRVFKDWKAKKLDSEEAEAELIAYGLPVPAAITADLAAKTADLTLEREERTIAAVERMAKMMSIGTISEGYFKEWLLSKGF